MMRASILLLLLLGAVGGARAEEFAAKVIAVLDGDTVLVKRAGGPVKIRLAEIDAPEVAHAGMGDQPHSSQKGQAYGSDSRRSLADMVLGKQVQVNSQATDQYGRMVAHLSIDGLDVNAEQIRRGMAWEYSHFHSNRALIALQQQAKQDARGLWAQANPTPPWDWRKRHPFRDKKHASAAASSSGCGNKKHCSQMSSCAEAMHYLNRYGVKSLDRDGDGVPCEKLCAGGINK